ncbi:endo-beta-1,4-xylanase [Podospora didyma]|uniref:Endo-1,4-beta-xylanase n=1 Tax=Podospora didyma TaxID=330526 RepID=A0AAE0NG21_9PEZI|nr:endo-beta-1,4-xylanase [Podospora didyma]
MENWTDGTAKVNCNIASPQSWNSSRVITNNAARNVSYAGTIESAGNAYVSLYGWTRNPQVEWYVVDWYGAHKPCTGNDTTIKWLDNTTTDGDQYEICTKTRVNKPSIDGTSTFPQFWSVRKMHRTNGTISSGAHFGAWKKAGLKLGKQQFMNLAVEGQDSNGTASFTVGIGMLPT